MINGLILLCFPTLLTALPQTNSTASVIETLRSPRTVAAQNLKNNPQSVNELKQISFNKQWPMNNRWKAFMVYVEIKEKKAFPEIKQALLSPTWFMRSAGLTAAQKVDPSAAQKWAFKLFATDKALLVRMKALEILKQSSSPKVKAMFWKKLFSQDNRKGNKSLWIRADIARILLEKSNKKDLKNWIQLLHESDKELQALATQGLKKVHQENDFEADQVSFWKNKYPKLSL